MSDDVFDTFMSSPQGISVVQARFKQLNNGLRASGRPTIEDGTPESISAKKYLITQILKTKQPLRSKVKDYSIDAARLQAKEGGFAPASTRPKADPEDKGQTKFEESSSAALLNVAKDGADTTGLEKTVVEFTVNGKPVKEEGFSIKGIVGNFKSASGKEYADIVYHPADKSISFVPEDFSVPVKKIKGPEMAQFIKNSYKVNGLKNEDLSRIDQMYGQQKKRIKESDIASYAAKANYSVKEYRELLIKNGVEIIK